ncbi:uncharacterized protein FTOL_12243 [Fusarium torulosum]|uniref:Uncharacterized protein n=1 Tax=Fusarium torulosum TaxID=33205 RepID=A0AAE8MK71_9HYPO|nr:uncharacterized protein FTOL_12243 [Fusarium torulosum]
MSPIPGLDRRQAVPVPPPTNPYARPGPAQHPPQRPTPYSGGRVDASKKGADGWRDFLNWFNDPGLGQDRTAVIIAVVLVCVFVIGVLAYLFLTKKKKLAVTSNNLLTVRTQLKESQDRHVDIQLEKNLHEDPPTKEEDAEKAKIQEEADKKVAEYKDENALLQAQVNELTKHNNFYTTFMSSFKR